MATIYLDHHEGCILDSNKHAWIGNVFDRWNDENRFPNYSYGYKEAMLAKYGGRVFDEDSTYVILQFDDDADWLNFVLKFSWSQ